MRSLGTQRGSHVGVGQPVVDDQRQVSLLGQADVPVQRLTLATRRRAVTIVVQARFANADDARLLSELGDAGSR